MEITNYELRIKSNRFLILNSKFVILECFT